MSTMRDTTATVREEVPHAQDCPVCTRPVVWLTTCHNLKRLAFEPYPLAARYDDGQGWAPGVFRVRSELRQCFAPMGMHPPAKRRRIAHVMRLHNCRRDAA